MKMKKKSKNLYEKKDQKTPGSGHIVLGELPNYSAHIRILQEWR